MSYSEAELIARAKAMYAAFNRRDWDAFFRDTDPEFERDPVEEAVVFRGREATLAGAENWFAAWQQFGWEPDAVEVGPGGETMFVALRSWGTSKGSQAVIEGRWFPVWRLRDGKLWKRVEYTERAAAMAAFEAARAPGLAADRLAGEHAALVRAILESFNAGDAFTDYEVALEELHGAGGLILAMVRERGHGKASGLEFDARVAYLYTVAEGRVVRIEGFWERDAALRVAQARAGGLLLERL